MRALTRKPDSLPAKGVVGFCLTDYFLELTNGPFTEVASLGAEVVQADFGDLPSLCRAFKGTLLIFWYGSSC